jgi:hypothetical protein
MNNASLLRLLSLSAIWGASFLFMRIGVPALGPTLIVFSARRAGGPPFCWLSAPASGSR